MRIVNLVKSLGDPKETLTLCGKNFKNMNDIKNVSLIEPRHISERSFSKWRMIIKDSKEIAKNSQK